MTDSGHENGANNNHKFNIYYEDKQQQHRAQSMLLLLMMTIIISYLMIMTHGHEWAYLPFDHTRAHHRMPSYMTQPGWFCPVDIEPVGQQHRKPNPRQSRQYDGCISTLMEVIIVKAVACHDPRMSCKKYKEYSKISHFSCFLCRLSTRRTFESVVITSTLNDVR